MTESLINQVAIFTNGMCAAFNSDGEQMPEFGGRWNDMKADIKTNIAERKVSFTFVKWHVGSIDISPADAYRICFDMSEFDIISNVAIGWED